MKSKLTLYHVDYNPQKFKYIYILAKILCVSKMLVCCTYLMKSYVLAHQILGLIGLLVCYRGHMTLYFPLSANI